MLAFLEDVITLQFNLDIKEMALLCFECLMVAPKEKVIKIQILATSDILF